MSTSPVKTIKQSQRESQFMRAIAELLRETALDDSRLQGVFPHRVHLSPDGKICFVYFYTPEGEEHFQEILEVLKLYRPSLRKALAQRLNRRYTPELLFKYDTLFEKQEKLEQLFEKIKADPSSS